MLTYNHAPYIEQALNGILNQETDFGFEILIHDDASNDGTQEIIKKYREKYPKIIKPILQKKNIWSQGINPSIEFNYPRANSEYIAWCEGDDAWIHPKKLSTQIRGLQENPDCDLSFHQAFLIYSRQKFREPIIIGNYSDENRRVSFHEAIYRPYGLIPTASCIARVKIKNQLLEFMKNRPYIRGGDVFLQMFGSMEGGALYYAIPMSIYRYQTPHSLTKGWQDDIEKTSNHHAAVIRSYLEINKAACGTLSKEIKRLIFQRVLWLFGRTAVPPVIIKKLNLLNPLKIYLKVERGIIKKALDLSREDIDYVIYGCGSGCQKILKKINKKKVLCIIDRDRKKAGEEILSIPIISEDQLNQFRNYQIIVSTLDPDRKIIETIASQNDIPIDHVSYFYDDIIDDIDIDLLAQDARNAPAPLSGKQPQGWWLPASQ